MQRDRTQVAGPGFLLSGLMDFRAGFLVSRLQGGTKHRPYITGILWGWNGSQM